MASKHEEIAENVAHLIGLSINQQVDSRLIKEALDLVRSEALEEGLSNMMQAIEICKDLNSLLCRVHIPAQMFHSESCTICKDINKANKIMDKMQKEWESIRKLNLRSQDEGEG